MIALLPADQQPAALARIALRSDSRAADAALAAPDARRCSQVPGSIYERAAYLRRAAASDAMALRCPRSTRASEGRRRRAPETDRRKHGALRPCAAATSAAPIGAAANTGLDRGRGRRRGRVLRRLDRAQPPEDPVAARRPLRAPRSGSAPRRSPRAGPLLAGPRRRGPGRPAAAQAFYLTGRPVHHRVLRPAGRRERAGVRTITLPRTRSSPRPTARGSRGVSSVRAIRVLYETGNKDLSRSSRCTSTTPCPPRPSAPCWSIWRAATAIRIRPCGPCARRPSAA